MILRCFSCYKGVKKSQNKAKIDEKSSKIVFLGLFFKSSKKNFNFALIRPFFGGRAQALKMGVDFCPFWIETIWESVLRVPIRLLLSDAFFSGPGGPSRDPPFLTFFDFLPFLTFLVIFGHFWVFFGCFLMIFEGL